MKTRRLAPQELPALIARFAQLPPNKDAYARLDGVPPAAYEMVAAKDIYVLYGPPPPAGNQAATAPAVTAPGAPSVYIVRCPPGNGPALHAHMRTRETFLALDEPFEISLNDDGELRTRLEARDLIAVPPGVTRRFRNVGERDGHLLVLVEGAGEEVLNDLSLLPSTGKEIARRYGPAARQGLERIGMAFDIEEGS